MSDGDGVGEGDDVGQAESVGHGVGEAESVGEAEVAGHGVSVAPPLGGGVARALPQAPATMAAARSTAIARILRRFVIDRRCSQCLCALWMIPMSVTPFGRVASGRGSAAYETAWAGMEWRGHRRQVGAASPAPGAPC